MSSTSDTSEAFELLAQGNPGFRVVCVQSHEEWANTMFVIAVPKALKRNGLFGQLAQAFGAEGHETKFGNELDRTLNGFDGVESGLSKALPHAIFVTVDHSANFEPAPDGFIRMANGLPGPVCVAIQAVIIANDGPIQRLAEYLRRLF